MLQILLHYCAYTFLLGFISLIYYFFAKIKLTKEEKRYLFFIPQFVWVEKDKYMPKIMIYWSYTNLIFFIIIIAFGLAPFDLSPPHQEMPTDNINSDDMAEGVANVVVELGSEAEIFFENIVSWITLILSGVLGPFLLAFYYKNLPKKEE